MQDLDQQTQGTLLSTSPQAHIWLTPTPAAASPGTMDKLEQSSRAYLKRKAKDASVADDRALQKIRDDFKRAMEMGDEKIELAAQTYELVRSAFDYVSCRWVVLNCVNALSQVDKHIRRLDADLKKFEAELEQQGDQSCAARVKHSHRDTETHIRVLSFGHQKPRAKARAPRRPNTRKTARDKRRGVCRVVCRVVQA